MIKILKVSAMTEADQAKQAVVINSLKTRAEAMKKRAEVEQKIAAQVRKEAIAKLIAAQELPADFVDKL